MTSTAGCSLADRQHGYILLPVMFTVALVATIAFLMSHETVTNIALLENDLDVARADYVAQAGLQHALWQADAQGCGPFTDLSDQPLDNDRYTTTLTGGGGGTTNHTVLVDQDTWIRSDQPDATGSSDNKLHVRHEGGVVERSLLRFDLSGIPANAEVLSATAWFYVNTAHPEGPIDIHAITADWTDADADWNKMASQIGDATLTQIPTQSDNFVWVSVPLTVQIQAWVNGQPNYGIALNATGEGTYGEYLGVDDSSYPPYIEVVTGSLPANPVTVQAVGTTAEGVSRSITRGDVVPYQRPPGAVELRPGGNGYDAEIWDQQPDNNYGNAAETWVSSAAKDTTRTLLRFDLSALPTGARILAATLSLERQSGSGADQPVSVHRITNSWDEDSVTWNNRSTGSTWDTSGADFDSTAVATTPVGPANQRYEWGIASLVQGWVDGSFPNYGVALVAAIAGMRGERFYTGDAADPASWPKLTITYTCACGVACLAPKGSGKIAMVVDYDGTNLTGQDAAKKAQFEQWGYEVDTHDDTWLWLLNTQAYNVVYISSSASASAVGTQFVGETLGVVIENGELNDEYGISSGNAWPALNTIDVVDNNHALTHLFPLGALRIADNSVEGLSVSGSEAADLQTLGEVGSTGALVALEAGAVKYGGGVAAGRRVMLPLGRNQDFSNLNNNGRLLVQRAIEWAKADSCADTFYGDDFENASYANNDGTLNWLGGWSETDADGAGASAGNVQIDTGRLRLDDNPDTGGEPSAVRSMNLDGTDTASLTFDYEMGTGVGVFGDAARIEISTDGISWTTLATFSVLSGRSGAMSHDLSAHLGPDTRIRFRITSGYGGSDDYLAIDNLRVYVCGEVAKDKVIYWTDDVANKIQRSTSDGSSVEDVLTGLAAPKGLDIDTINGKLYWTEGSVINRSDLDGSNVETLYSGLLTTFDVKLDVVGGKMYWTVDSNNRVLRANLDGSGSETIDTSHDRPAYITIDASAGHLYLTSFGDGDVSRINLDGSGVAVLVTGPTGAVGNGLDLDGGKMYWSGGATNGWIKRSDVDGSDVETIVTGLNAPQDIDVDANNGKLYWVDALNQLVQRSDTDGANVETLVAGLSRPRGIVVVDADAVPPLTGGGGGSPLVGSCSGTYRDEFDDGVSFAGSNGSIDWSASPWSEVGESDGPDAGDVGIDEDESKFQLRLKDNDNGGEGVERTVDLSGATSAELRYDFRRHKLDKSSDYVAVQVRASNGDPWTELTRHTGLATDGGYQAASHDISGHIAATTLIRFITSPSMGGSDIVWFDNIEVSCE